MGDGVLDRGKSLSIGIEVLKWFRVIGDIWNINIFNKVNCLSRWL